MFDIDNMMVMAVMIMNIISTVSVFTVIVKLSQLHMLNKPNDSVNYLRDTNEGTRRLFQMA